MTGPQDTDGRKVASLRELPRAIEPPRDLWPHIKAQLDEIQAAAPPTTGAQLILARQGGARLRWLALAAMLASVAVGVWIGRSFLPGGGGTPLPVTASKGATPVTAAAALDAAYVSDPRYQRQRAALLRSLQSQLATLPPATRSKVLASLATVEKAKQDLEQALGKDPGNALLQELLINTYQDEMRVLTDVRDASDPGRGI
jgi:hypothetical protein